MGFDRARVVQLWVPDSNGSGGTSGSGYRVGDDLILTAHHVVATLPLHSVDQRLPTSEAEAGGCRMAPLGASSWAVGAVVWRAEAADLAVLRCVGLPPLPAGSPPVRW